jgi:DNA-binding NtrC family response regulator
MPAPPRHVLLVEDHWMVRAMLEQTLVAFGYRVTVAETCDQAAALLAGELRPDILLSDIRMPGRLNGLDLARAARLQRASIAVVLQTGFTDVDTGDFLVLHKPFEPDTLLDALEAALAERAAHVGSDSASGQ